MTKEHPHPHDAFGFTEHERLWERINHTRFLALLADPHTTIHHIEVSTNDYGEFLFVTLSQQIGQERQFVTLWGAGYHDQRERWLIDEGGWYETQQYRQMIPQQIALEDAQALVQERLAEIAPSVSSPHQSKRAKLFELLADLTDEDGALTDLDDLGIWDDDDLDAL